MARSRFAKSSKEAKSASTRGTKRKRGRRKKLKKPKRFKTAFNFFQMHLRNALFDDDIPKSKRVEHNEYISRIVGQKWKDLSDEERLPFEEKARLDRKRYEIECKAFDAKMSAEQENAKLDKKASGKKNEGGIHSPSQKAIEDESSLNYPSMHQLSAMGDGVATSSESILSSSSDYSEISSHFALNADVEDKYSRPRRQPAFPPLFPNDEHSLRFTEWHKVLKSDTQRGPPSQMLMMTSTDDSPTHGLDESPTRGLEQLFSIGEETFGCYDRHSELQINCFPKANELARNSFSSEEIIPLELVSWLRDEDCAY
mmetsp:Transcript_22002/g.44165  ORF Transcript_22002/g.44165 Transcript_22002/m.44165 type:complete len:313 (-) Transcript_22002:313-1251(-)|eukprot:CAMPEP_0167789388 /NCGR_PEP_ID=MMETSP0111_2-20121227/10655_1 /TAXON_ID=91324 /ORGANISM="Lotharella globosa, Strain CCCM811" /LENGTH=312 /DNA_ID=CAMNT_0007681545 /DNA_START=62 /DNA_END=1000 /DNA_ORIENTATION=-